MADDPRITERGTTNYLGIPEAQYAELQTENAFKRFNSAKRRPNERRDDRDDDGRRA